MRPPAADVPARPEAALLLCCARTCLDTERAARLRVLLQHDFDWSSLLRTALRHGVLPLLYQHLRALGPDAVPPAVLTQLREQVHAHATSNLLLTGALLEVLHLLETHALPALPFKGPTLAVAVYGNLALRQFSDVDLLVHARDYRRVQQLLIAHGYQLLKEFQYASSLVHATSRVGVDLHRGLVPHQFHVSLDFERMWTSRQPLALVGTPVATLAPEDLLMVLCVQVSRDTWGTLFKPLKRRYDSLLKFCDIAELLRVRPDMDWGRVLADTRRLGAQRMLLFGLCVASELLGTALPQAVRARVQAHPMLRVLTAYTRARLFDDVDDRAAPALTPARFHWVIRERWRDKVFPYLYAGALLIVPSEKDQRCLPLPRYLAFLYYVIRPCRAVRDYGWRLFFQHLKRWLVWGSETREG